MEPVRLILVLASNLSVLALAWSIYVVTGYLLFRRALRTCPFVIRLNLYPLLGWAFLVTFAYYLRILALPFAVSGPWALGALLVALILWNRDFQRPKLRRPLPRVLLMLGALFALNLIPLYLRLAVPDMRDVGTWGFDQRNYVFTAAGLLDEGLLPAIPHSGTPWGLLVPYWEYVKDSVRQMVSLSPMRLDWMFVDLQEKFETVRSASRDFALFPRRAFSSLDALMASVLRIDPQQAYTLSIWMQHIWLLHVAVILSRLLHWKKFGLLLTVLLVVYWPNSHLAVAADNRDQGNCLILIFLFLIFARLLPSAFWPIVTCACALLVGYPELAIPALVAFYGQRYDTAPGARQWIMQTGRELGVTLLCLLPLLPPALLGLMFQWGKQSDNRGLVFPVQYATPLARFDYLPGWKLLWSDVPGLRYLVLLLDLLLLAFAAYGLFLVCQRKQFGSVIGHGIVLVCGYVFLSREEYYPAYKVLTVVWPFFLWILFLAFSRSLTSTRSSLVRPLVGYALAIVIIISSLPAIVSKAQIVVPGFYELVGPNRSLADPLLGGISAFLRPRMSDINRLKEISREVSDEKQNVLIITHVAKATPHDFGFCQLLLRNASVFYPRSDAGGIRLWWRPPYPGFRAASSHQSVDRIFLLNSANTFKFHYAQSHLFAGAYDKASYRQMNYCADLRLRNREHLLIICRSGTWDLNEPENEKKQRFPLTDGTIALDLYHVNAPTREVFLSFSVYSADSSPVGNRLEVLLNGKPVQALHETTLKSVATRTIRLDSDAMHQQIVIRIREEVPGSPNSQWYFEVTGFDASASVDRS
jgi:hypothetical protein